MFTAQRRKYSSVSNLTICTLLLPLSWTYWRSRYCFLRHGWKPRTINWQWASGCAIHLVSSISVIPTGAAAAALGYHRALPGPRRSVPLCQVLADCRHVCFLVHDCGHDDGPPLCHLLPSASVPWWQTFTLEHAHHGGLGPGPDTQFTTGVKDRILNIFVFEVSPWL